MSQICRLINGEPVWMDKSEAAKKPAKAMSQTVLSDSLGCIAQQVDEMREAARRDGFTAVDWVPDKTCIIDGQPTWYTFSCSDAGQASQWAERCNQTDGHHRNGAGNIIDGDHIASVSRKMRDKYQPRD